PTRAGPPTQPGRHHHQTRHRTDPRRSPGNRRIRRRRLGPLRPDRPRPHRSTTTVRHLPPGTHIHHDRRRHRHRLGPQHPPRHDQSRPGQRGHLPRRRQILARRPTRLPAPPRHDHPDAHPTPPPRHDRNRPRPVPPPTPQPPTRHPQPHRHLHHRTPLDRPASAAGRASDPRVPTAGPSIETAGPAPPTPLGGGSAHERPRAFHAMQRKGRR